jgi:acyl-coenzyme A synthetase/AMP-(fatty) acid ligase
MSLFWIDDSRGLEISYKGLYEDLIKEGEGNVYIQYKNPYLVFVSLLRNLLSQKKSIILDADFSTGELLTLGVSEEELLNSKYFQYNLSVDFKSLDEIFDLYNTKKEELEIEIFTSGTSGKPKKVNQNLVNIVRAVKVNPSFEKNIWGFAYNPTHFAGLQVFFQAFFNKNTLVYIFDSDYEIAYKMFRNYGITHLSCTPTFMKMLIPYVSKSLENVSSLTFGGEKFDSNMESRITEKFPNAIIKNVYASTEAGSLLRTDGEFFVIPERYKLLIKIDNDELLINKELLGKSESFILEGNWYRTGDLVQFIDHEKFKFLSRKSEMINVGGYKVNPSEVEDVIRKVEGVKDIVVFGRANSIMGNVIVANIIKEEGQENKQLKERIKKGAVLHLQEFKIPRIINFVDSFELTRTGKIKKA